MAAGSTVASGCGTQSGDALAKQACGYVYSSIAFYESSLGHKTTSQASHLQAEAYDQLQLGLQPAALAAGDDGQWQALMTTISESSRVPGRCLGERPAPTVRRRRDAGGDAAASRNHSGVDTHNLRPRFQGRVALAGLAVAAK